LQTSSTGTAIAPLAAIAHDKKPIRGEEPKLLEERSYASFNPYS
jgi:hypothetical protein